MFISTSLAIGLYFSNHNDQRRWVALSTPTQQEVPAVFSPNFKGKTLFQDFLEKNPKTRK